MPRGVNASHLRLHTTVYATMDGVSGCLGLTALFFTIILPASMQSTPMHQPSIGHIAHGFGQNQKYSALLLRLVLPGGLQ